jgi:hypothetical protein
MTEYNATVFLRIPRTDLNRIFGEWVKVNRIENYTYQEMKIDRPFDQLREIFRAVNHENRELVKYVFEKSDSISLWIIGLSIGGISIFANNIADIQRAIPLCKLRPILLLLAISVTSGIVYRGLYLYFFSILNNTMRGIDIAFSNRQMMHTNSELTGKETYEELLHKIRSGTGEDFFHLMSEYNMMDDGAKQNRYNQMVDFYLRSVEFAKKDTESALDFIADTYSKFYGVSKRKFLKQITNGGDAAAQYRRTLILTSICYLIYITSFCTALFLFVFSV